MTDNKAKIIDSLKATVSNINFSVHVYCAHCSADEMYVILKKKTNFEKFL
jgi:hypothetical protein